MLGAQVNICPATVESHATISACFHGITHAKYWKTAMVHANYENKWEGGGGKPNTYIE